MESRPARPRRPRSRPRSERPGPCPTLGIVEPLANVTIEGRFNGPPDSANGGLCVRHASPASSRARGEVTLLSPPPLDRPLDVGATEDGLVAMHDGDVKAAEAHRSPRRM